MWKERLSVFAIEPGCTMKPSHITQAFYLWSVKILDSKRGIQRGLHVASMMAKEDPSGVQILTSANLSSASRNKFSQSAFSRSRELKKLSMTRSKNLREASARRRKTKAPRGQWTPLSRSKNAQLTWSAAQSQCSPPPAPESPDHSPRPCPRLSKPASNSAVSSRHTCPASHGEPISARKHLLPPCAPVGNPVPWMILASSLLPQSRLLMSLWLWSRVDPERWSADDCALSQSQRWRALLSRPCRLQYSQLGGRPKGNLLRDSEGIDRDWR